MNLDMWSEVARSVALFLAGMGTGMISLEVWHRRTTTDNPRLNIVLAAAILAVVTGGSLLGVWNSYAMRDQAQCQANVNERFLEVLRGNAELATQQRENLDETIAELAEGKGDQDAGAILREYLDQQEHIEAHREDYPKPPEEVCG